MSESGRSQVSVVLPTLGRSPLLEECLRALRREIESDGAGELIVVAQGDAATLEGCEVRRERWLRIERPLGFAGAVNRGIHAAAAPYVAVMNDDAVVEPGWLAALTAALDGDPEAASAQGLNLWTAEGAEGAGGAASGPARIDGRGMAWNRWLQAVQIGHGEASVAPIGGGEPEAPREVFGVSATAALYRREALLAVALPAPDDEPDAPPEVFDSRLGTYYEDVDLAVRLRAAGHHALSVPGARVRHAGSLTAGDGVSRWRRVHGNRYLVLARVLGRSFWGRLPRIVLRDLVDLAVLLAHGRWPRAAGIVAGGFRALRHLPGFVHTGPARLPIDRIVGDERDG